MYRRRLRPLPMLLVFASGLVFLLQTWVTGNLIWPSTVPHGLPAFILTPSTAIAASTAVPSDTKLPPHAVWQSWGNDWECQRGYRREDERCVEVQIPPHAFLDYSGHNWRCRRGYQRTDEGCVPVHVPEYAYLNYSGHGWVCKDGYQRVGTACEPQTGETPVREMPSTNELATLATQVYASPEASHDAQTIRQLQRQLQQAGYAPGPIDGILGPRTLEALQIFLSNSGLASGTASRQATPPASGS